jgi:hypothetical protein
MGCLCAGHANGAPAAAACDTTEPAPVPERAAPRAAAEVAAILAARPRSCRCSPKCPGWAVFEVDDERERLIQACDDCNGGAADAGHPEIDDDEAASLPAARRALAEELLTNGGRGTCRLKNRARALARAHALEVYDLRIALSDVIAWTSTTTLPPADALRRIRRRAYDALGVED